MIAIVVSRADSASEHLGEHLLELADWDRLTDDARPDAAGGGEYHRTDGFELRTFDDLHLHVDDAAAAFDDPDLLVFASRHSGETGPLLTAHFTGNFGPAEYGGESGDLAAACPNAHAEVVAAFAEHAPDGYDAGMECTHHGPSRVGVPSMFVELGSDEAQWADPEGARAVARAILDLRGVAPDRERTLVGFGGGHYGPRFTRIVRETDWAVGHIAADWCLDAMGDPAANREVVRRAFERSGASYAVLDGDYPDLERVVADLGYRVVSETWVREVDDRPLDAVEAVEDALTTVDDGLRFGDRSAADGFDVVSLPADLVDEAQGIDQAAARAAVAGETVAFETSENGNRLGAGAAVPADGSRDAVVDALVAVLAEGYDEVGREDGAVVAQETAFDPSLAREAGVPEGPAFGKLSAGESVTVDGETIRPADVRTERTRRFDL
ncbi:D-aminoacyl-tRNA deacylase [Halostella litorea]|uniref:D-aminoacyl-tRNA deacylase n=1 Tax=Halostella litorea TaxID=2528831 RepID=UPI001092CC17|nr:D-aminoacyl-tRNA deacylase [Halostella litorea]